MFNSYYQQIGQPFPRIRRGILSRPTVADVYAYREYVDKHLLELIDSVSEEDLENLLPLITLGLHHEQQHQELLLMDIKHNFSYDPSLPIYEKETSTFTKHTKKISQFLEIEGGIISIGHEGNAFCFDNELPRHEHLLKPYQLANRLVTNGEYCEFIEAKGYEDPKWWLADGWETVQREGWFAPLYWHKQDNAWYVYTLKGLKPLDEAEPVSHVSFYEADAYARWRHARLPNEVEWEHAAQNSKVNGNENFLEARHFHPIARFEEAQKLQQLFGDVWEWTMSPYTPYPGYTSAYDALGEYNGKFMSNQMVLRGGSCVTPKNHIRHSYRNFFQPDKRWQFSGIRLAKNIEENA